MPAHHVQRKNADSKAKGILIEYSFKLVAHEGSAFLESRATPWVESTGLVL